MQVFTKLLELLFPPRPDELVVRTCKSDDLFALSNPVVVNIGQTPVTGLLPYRNETVRACIREAKFHKNEKAMHELSAVLADHLLERVVDETAFGTKIALVPVPLGAKRLKERGYNQTTEVCRLALTRLGNSVRLMEDALIRTKETLPQTELSGNARRHNMQGAFSASRPLDPSLSYILIDDVMTTGATLLSAIQSLREGGATHISATTLAH